jgi:hypothetical protein
MVISRTGSTPTSKTILMSGSYHLVDRGQEIHRTDLAHYVAAGEEMNDENHDGFMVVSEITPEDNVDLQITSGQQDKWTGVKVAGDFLFSLNPGAVLLDFDSRANSRILEAAQLGRVSLSTNLQQ